MLKLKENLWIIGLVFVTAVLIGIFFAPTIQVEKKYLQSGEKKQKLKQFKEAIDDYERVVRSRPQSPEAIRSAKYAAEICLYELKDYKRAEEFFRHVVKQGTDPGDIRWAQKNLGDLFYENLSNYSQAVAEYQRLLQGDLELKEESAVRLKVVRSYFYMANFDQAISEAEEFLARKPNAPNQFEMRMLIANAYQAKGKLDSAIAIFESIEKDFPGNKDLSQAKLNKALAFENKKDWDSAIKTLEEVKVGYPYPDVIDVKIKGIQRRKARKKD